MSVEINVLKCFRELIRKWWIIVITMISLFLVSLFMTSKSGEDNYIAVSTVYSVAYGSYQESVEGAAAMQTYSEIITSSKVTERAALLLGEQNITGETIKSLISISFTGEASSILSIQAFYNNPDVAVGIVNAVAEAFVIEVRNITGENNVQVLDKATEAGLYYSANAQQNKIRVFAVLLGFILSCAGIVCHTVFTSRIGSIKECTLDGELDLIGVIPRSDKM